ncbi:hypothetical protein [Streptomyces sp. Go-475]|uniref:hypothetical protein n=1 Tax=Streptomyces sp. Go-475 TaxID=2072505 RepID=UPI000DEFF9FD|nr:hypothetical protein [Streptomyces sp. Go-475]AXE87602.1 hypothetical protein C1703_21610 [Streptomyces sp. Go-475]
MADIDRQEDGYAFRIPTLNEYGIPVRSGDYWVGTDLATQWLERNLEENRKVSTVRVKRYAKAMAEGRWKLTHQSIAFDQQGNLIDGQHRLMAVIHSKTVVPIRVHVGADPSTFAVIDTGYGRVASQFMRVANANIVKGAARIILFAEQCRENGGEVALMHRSTFDNDVIFETVDQWPELQEYSAAASRIYRACGSSSTNMLAVLAQASRGKNPGAIDSFVEKMILGEDMSKGDPALLLRNRAIARMDRSLSYRDKTVLYGTTVKAWNAHAKGEKLKFLRFIYDDKSEEGMLPVSAGKGSTGMREKIPEVY